MAVSANQLIGSITAANSLANGYLTSVDWNIFNNKQNALTLGNETSADLTINGGNGAIIGGGMTLSVNKGDLTESGSSVLTITGGGNSVIGSGTAIQVKQAGSSQAGYLSGGDWTNFNSKVSSQWATNGQDISYSTGNVGIGTSTPVSSAALDVASATKGFLPPRVALAAINSSDPVSSPATGLLVYNTSASGTVPYNVVPGNYYWNGVRWIAITPPQGTNPGDMLYWDGMQWLSLPAGSNGQVLTFNDGVPDWGGAQLPILNTLGISSITVNSAQSGGYIASDGGIPVASRGACWGISINPTIAGNHSSDGTGTGTFITNLTGLTANTFYYVRAYATNSSGISYGDQRTFTTSSFSPGTSYGGGIIFYVDGTGRHGMIAATSDQGSGVQFGYIGTTTGATGTAIGTGQSNTAAILNACNTVGIASRLCDNLVLNGYDDWFLPSKDELNQLYIYKSLVNGFARGYYWSSSECSADYAWSQSFDNGHQSNTNSKNYSNYARAVRAF